VKRILTFLLALWAAASFAACGQQPDETTSATNDAPATKTIYVHSSVTQEFGSSVTRTEYAYDDENRISNIVVYTNDVEAERYNVESNADGNAVRWTNGETTMESSYDDLGRTLGTVVYMNGTVVSSTAYIWEGNLRTGVISSGEGFESRHNFIYDEAGHLIRQDIYTNGELTGYSICTNDENGRILHATSYLPDGSENYTITYTYGDDTETRTTSLPDGTVSQKTIVTYDENGNLSTSVSYNGEGTITSKETHAWRAIIVPIDSPRAPI
jgi:hypothetical protein